MYHSEYNNKFKLMLCYWSIRNLKDVLLKFYLKILSVDSILIEF